MSSDSRNKRMRGRMGVRFGVDKPERMAFTMNVSRTGAFIRTNNVFPPGKTIKVELSVNNEKCEMWAKVIWAKRVPPQMAHLLLCGMGVRFMNADAAWDTLVDKWEARA